MVAHLPSKKKILSLKPSAVAKKERKKDKAFHPYADGRQDRCLKLRVFPKFF
jgi:hypothetical protein